MDIRHWEKVISHWSLVIRGIGNFLTNLTHLTHPTPYPPYPLFSLQSGKRNVVWRTPYHLTRLTPSFSLHTPHSILPTPHSILPTPHFLLPHSILHTPSYLLLIHRYQISLVYQKIYNLFKNRHCGLGCKIFFLWFYYCYSYCISMIFIICKTKK